VLGERRQIHAGIVARDTGAGFAARRLEVERRPPVQCSPPVTNPLHYARTDDAAVARQRRRDRNIVIGTLLVAGLLIGFYLVSSSVAARQRERERERAAVAAQRKLVEQARDRRARAMLQRPSFEAARRAVQDLKDKGQVHRFDFDTGTMRVDLPAWSAMTVDEKQAAARLFALACSPPEDAQLHAVRILGDCDDTLLAEYDSWKGATIHR
jgi:hypothetical protein